MCGMATYPAAASRSEVASVSSSPLAGDAVMVSVRPAGTDQWTFSSIVVVGRIS